MNGGAQNAKQPSQASNLSEFAIYRFMYLN